MQERSTGPGHHAVCHGGSAPRAGAQADGITGAVGAGGYDGRSRLRGHRKARTEPKWHFGDLNQRRIKRGQVIRPE